MSAPPGWKFGDPMTDEMKARRRETFARNKSEGKHKKSGRPTSRPRPPRPETPPVRGGIAGLTEKTRKKCVSIVERLVMAGDAGVAWAMRQSTRAIYTEGPDGKPLIDAKTHRPIIQAQVRAFDDATIAADRLEEWERRWLAEELTNEMLRYKRLRAFLLRLVDLEERSSLPMCVTILALPRLARHGVIPQEMQKMVEEMRDAARKVRRAPKPEPAELVAPPTQEEPPVAAAAD